jgi:hypothetical protein
VTVTLSYHVYSSELYDIGHAAAHLTGPAITTAARYKATDIHPPSWFAAFDVACLDVLVARLTVNFTTLQISARRLHPFPRFFIAPAVNPVVQIEDEQNRWYAEEHLALLPKLPGFLQARRLRLVNYLAMPIGIS